MMGMVVKIWFLSANIRNKPNNQAFPEGGKNKILFLFSLDFTGNFAFSGGKRSPPIVGYV
jgi:hypothetical protein